MKYKLSKDNPLHDVNRHINFFINRYYIFLVILLMALAVFIRAYKFGLIPYGFNQDEAMSALNGLTLSKYGTDYTGMSFPVYFTAWGVSQMNVLLSYILIPFFKIFGATVFTARLPLLIFSVISVWVLYRFSYAVFGKFAALAVLFFITINPWQIMISRWALESNLFPIFVLYASYLLYLGIVKRKIYLYLSMLLFGLSMYSYGVSYYTVPLLLIILCVYFLYIKAVKIKHVLLCAFCCLLISWPIFLMVIVNYFKLDTIKISLMAVPYFPQSEQMNNILFFSCEIPFQFINNVRNLVGTVFLQSNDMLWNSVPAVGPMYFLSLPFFVTGFILMFIKFYKDKDLKNNSGMFIILSLFITALISGLITNDVNINRINLIFFPLVIFTGYAVFVICRRYKFLVIPVFIVFSLFFANFSAEYFSGGYSRELGREFYYGFSDALLYVRNLNYDKLYITSDTQYKDSDYTSEIIALYNLEIDNKYYLGKGNAYGPDGKVLPGYHLRYIYGISAEEVDIGDVNSVYVINKDEISCFYGVEKYYDFVQFGSYYAVVNKNYSD